MFLIGNFVKREQCRRDDCVIYFRRLGTRFCAGFSVLSLKLFLSDEETIFKTPKYLVLHINLRTYEKKKVKPSKYKIFFN